jgi:hypothetical protein
MSLPMLTLPSYEIFLPGIQEKVAYRPFNVKEEKVLLIAMQEPDFDHIIKTVKNLLSVCTFNKLNVDDLPQVDAELLFVCIRNKSLGEGVEVISTCTNCEAKNYMQLDLSKYEIENLDTKTKSTVQLSDNVWVKMRYPTLKMSMEAVKEEDEVDGILKVVAKCIVSVIQGEQVFSTADLPEKDVVDWMEGLTQEQLTKISDFLESIPQLVFNQDYKCIKCGHSNHIEMRGMEAFFD